LGAESDEESALAVAWNGTAWFGQAVFTGSGACAGAAQFAVGGSGAAQTYAARTDNCVTGAESGCVPKALTGRAGSPMSFILRNADAIPFSEEAFVLGRRDRIRISVPTWCWRQIRRH
jgi:hypothetical protein